MGIRVVVSEPKNWNLGNLFGEIVSERGDTLKVKLSRTLHATDFSSDVIIFYSDDGKSFKALSQQYAVFVSGYLVDKNNNLSELILKGTISYD